MAFWPGAPSASSWLPSEMRLPVYVVPARGRLCTYRAQMMPSPSSSAMMSQPRGTGTGKTLNGHSHSFMPPATIETTFKNRHVPWVENPCSQRR